MSGQSVWSGGAAYEPYVGRWSRLVAREFVRWLAVKPGSQWLDVGCGTGALTDTIIRDAHPARVVGIDPSEGFLEVARAQVRDPRARFEIGDAQRLVFAAGTYDAAASGLVLNFVPDIPGAIAEMVRVVRPGGVVACYVWDYAGKMELVRYFWDAAVVLKPEDREHDEGHRFPVCRPDPLQVQFEGAGLAGVQVRSIDVPTRFVDFDDYWNPFLGGQFPAPAYVMALPEDARNALRDRIRTTLPIAADGSIDLVARAWAVCGTRPT